MTTLLLFPEGPFIAWQDDVLLISDLNPEVRLTWRLTAAELADFGRKCVAAAEAKPVADHQLAVCQYCGSDKIEDGYGLAGGCLGPYGVCQSCGRMVWKAREPEAML